MFTYSSDLGYSIPAWLTPTCVRVIHNVIKNKKICLKLQNSSKDSCMIPQCHQSKLLK